MVVPFNGGTRKIIRKTIRLLKRGDLAILPCDTIYGIVGAAPATEQRIRRLKGRGKRPFIQLIPSASWLCRFTEVSLPASLQSYWPGPLTIIFPGSTALEGNQTVALRLPADTFLQELLFELDCPLYSTSVNLSGGEALWKIGDIIAAFAQEVGFIIDAGDLPGQSSSTILDICQKPYQIIRQGALQLPDHLFFI